MHPRLLLVVLFLPMLLQAQEDFDRLTFHVAPKPLHSEAVTEDWPRFLGPHDKATSGETHLLDNFPEEGPKLVWEVARGNGYTCPTIVGDRLLLHHNIDDTEIVECLHPETGQRYWEFTWPNRYRDRLGYSNGPRASPVVSGGRVYTLAATSQLHCLDLETGAVIWERDLAEDYGIPQYFFGHGPSPLILRNKVILNLGGSKGVCVAAFDTESGETVWETPYAWNASYASAIAAEMYGKDVVFVFAGGESDPPTGGLLAINPESGELYDAFPWRASIVNSVNAASPILFPGNRVMISETYTEGAVMLELDENMQMSPVWEAPQLQLHWTQGLNRQDYFYAFTGRNEPDAALDCWNMATGELVWRKESRPGGLYWERQGPGNKYGWSFFRGSILWADETAFALGEMGTLAILDLSPEGVDITSKAELFAAAQTWTLPAVHRGLLYVCQNEPGLFDDTEPRVLCYDLREPASP